MTEQTQPSVDTLRLPRLRFSTRAFEAPEQFDAWSQFVANLSDIKRTPDMDKGFDAAMQVVDTGVLNLMVFHTPTLEFLHHATFDPDCLFLTIPRRGSIRYTSADGEFQGRIGEPHLKSLAKPFRTEMTNVAATALFFSREKVPNIAHQLDSAYQSAISDPMACILAEFITTVERQADRLTLAEANTVNDAFVTLLGATFRGTTEAFGDAAAPIAAAQYSMVRRFIDKNLTSPRLTPNGICASLKISRRHLYYLFERNGGVMKYITQQRLEKCHAALVKGTGKDLISTIAYQHGFTNLSSFYRQFQNRYGYAPGDVRVASLNGLTPRNHVVSTFQDWFTRTEPE
ncbi:helix-turn-helix domain-containing protein [Rhodospirillum sp. A1_3_36]|uniref:helix-turn-helix domain-containing protein n=1 Tax=Rhodospirillum sp. A1_3_36 TaxID=3391666 RepID=UPI0039A50563